MPTLEENIKFITDAHIGNKYLDILGLEFVELNEKTAIGRIPYKEETLNPYGFVHGGALYSMADITAGYLACIMSGNCMTTATGSLNFIAPAKNTEYIYCHATLIHGGRKLVVVRVEIKNDQGKLLDDGSFTFFNTGVTLDGMDKGRV